MKACGDLELSYSALLWHVGRRVRLFPGVLLVRAELEIGIAFRWPLAWTVRNCKRPIAPITQKKDWIGRIASINSPVHSQSRAVRLLCVMAIY